VIQECYRGLQGGGKCRRHGQAGPPVGLLDLQELKNIEAAVRV
jgi:hypothetical protein